MSALVASIAERLSKLSILPGNNGTDDSTTLKTYTFKPKGSGADIPKLVVVIAEQSKDIGKASALAKKLGHGIKDMRAAEEEYIKQVLGDVETKESGKSITLDRFYHYSLIILMHELLSIHCPSPVSPFSITEENAPSILLVLSDSIPTSTTSISLPSINTTLSSSSDLLKYLKSTSVKTQELEFLSKGSDGVPSVPSTSVPISNSSKSGIIPASKAQTPGTSKLNATTSEELLQKPGNLDSLGVTIKKDGDDFGMWYRQVLTYGDMLDYYDVSGCYILKPASYCIWESIQGESEQYIVYPILQGLSINEHLNFHLQILYPTLSSYV